MSHIADSVSYRNTVESGWFVPDHWRGLTGGIPVDPSFLEELERIDRRLVVRKPPWSEAVQIYLRLPDGRLWCEPVHECRHPETGRPWKPGNFDLERIKRAKYYYERTGWKDRMESSWRQEREKEEKASQRRESMIREGVSDYLRKNDISARKLGAARGPMGS